MCILRDRQQDAGRVQAAKKHHIAVKLLLDHPNLSVLGIGCGWGGPTITLSEEQLTFARKRAGAAGLSNRVRFELMDYRAAAEFYDRVVSVDMFEHGGAVLSKLGPVFRSGW